MPDFFTFSLSTNMSVFCAAAAVIAFAGWQLAAMADRFADRTGMGEALAGALLLGAVTSLPEAATSLTAATGGHADLAVGNVLGGIAAQMAFLSIADISYRRANLEHAAASLSNLMQAALLVTLLAMVLIASSSPALSVGGIHVMSPLMLVGYAFGMRMVWQARSRPMWRARRTAETREDEPEMHARQQPIAVLIARFLAFAAAVGFAGWVIARTGIALVVQTGISETAVGAVFTAIATSAPELATALSAVRQGALTLAVGNIIGGNIFDSLIVALADLVYPGGSIYSALSAAQQLVIAVVILQSGILLLGFMHREKHGIANIGFESFLILLVYAAMVGLLFSQ